jgi:tRNA 2-selenouridine synthase
MLTQAGPVGFLELAADNPVVDVRSPAEYTRGHIPGATSLPLFTDEERARVGTLYARSGRDASVLLGMEIAGPKSAGYVRTARRVSPGGKILVHCWRGGLRSEAMAWLLHTAGFAVTLLEGGYRAYRRFIRSGFGMEAKLVVLSGMTGSGKTDILKQLRRLGEQVIDLEGISNHKGSAFGSIGQPPQPSNEQFENDLFAVWHSMDKSKTIWLEDESLNVGKVTIPPPLFDRMMCSPVVMFSLPVELRIQNLVKEYASHDKEELAAVLDRLERRLGGVNARLCREALAAGDYVALAGLLLAYYDKAYEKSCSRYDRPVILQAGSHIPDPAINAMKVLEGFRKHGNDRQILPKREEDIP